MFHICDVEWMYLCVWRFFAPETSEGLRPKSHIYIYIHIIYIIFSICIICIRVHCGIGTMMEYLGKPG